MSERRVGHLKRNVINLAELTINMYPAFHDGVLNLEVKVEYMQRDYLFSSTLSIRIVNPNRTLHDVCFLSISQIFAENWCIRKKSMHYTT